MFYSTRNYASLTPEQQKLVDRLYSNELLNICEEKNQAYGHGTGTTKPTTQHDAILHRMTCLAMDKYFETASGDEHPTDGAPTRGGEHPTDGAPKRKRTDTPAHEDGRAKRVKPR